MKNILVAVLIFAFVSCKKDSDNTPSNTSTTITANSFSPLTAGSYWAYDWYVVDSSGNALFFNITDSIYIIGDTIIAGDTFAIQSSTWFGNPSAISYLRDSSDCLIDNIGRIYFSAANFSDTLYLWNSFSGDETGYLKMDSANIAVTVPAGTFNTINAKYTVVNNVGSWPCLGIYDVHNNQYADSAGKVKSSFQFTSDIACRVYEQRLRSYFIN